MIKVFDSLADTTPTIFADLRTNVHDYWDEDLLGMALLSDFPTDPYVYVLYAYELSTDGSGPVWGDACRHSGGEHRRLRHQRPAVAARGHRQGDDRFGAGPHRGLVSAIPEPFDRRPSPSAPMARST